MTEQDMDWDRLRVFLAVTEAGSFLPYTNER
jgi:hypothetical protein